MIQAGELRLRVAIQERDDAKGSRGQSTESWETIDNRWASKMDVSGDEQQWVRQLAPMATTVFEIRRPRNYTLSTRHRLRHRGTNYHIINIIGQDSTDQTLKLLCGSKGP